MNRVDVITVEQLAARFGYSTNAMGRQEGMRWAKGLMRKLRHVEESGQLFTTEEWLAEWLAAEAMPQQNWPQQNLDPLEEAVCSRVMQLLGSLAAQGKIKVTA
jgi:hypothetical protein